MSLWITSKWLGSFDVLYLHQGGELSLVSPYAENNVMGSRWRLLEPSCAVLVRPLNNDQLKDQHNSTWHSCYFFGFAPVPALIPLKPSISIFYSCHLKKRNMFLCPEALIPLKPSIPSWKPVCTDLIVPLSWAVEKPLRILSPFILWTLPVGIGFHPFQTGSILSPWTVGISNYKKCVPTLPLIAVLEHNRHI